MLRDRAAAAAHSQHEPHPAATNVTGRPVRGMERTGPSGVDSLPLAPYSPKPQAGGKPTT